MIGLLLASVDGQNFKAKSKINCKLIAASVNVTASCTVLHLLNLTLVKTVIDRRLNKDRERERETEKERVVVLPSFNSLGH